MLIEHGGRRPEIDPTAWIAPNATISGAVTIGPNVRILYNAVLTAEGGAELAVGSECVIMGHAVLRAAGRFPLRLGNRVLVGPHAYLTGCTIGSYCFIATGAMVFNGAKLGDACTLALDGKVHIDTELRDGTFVPIGHIAFGPAGRIYSPAEAAMVHDALNRLGFMHYVFGIDVEGKERAEIMGEMLRKYARALAGHMRDRVIAADP